MKKDAVRTEVNSHLKALGFRSNQYRWMGCEVHVVVGGEFRTFRFPAGKAKRETYFELGRLSGLVEAFGQPTVAPIAVAKPNGVAHAL